MIEMHSMLNRPVHTLWVVCHYRKVLSVPLTRAEAERFALSVHAAHLRDGVDGPINLVRYVEYRSRCGC